MKKKFSLVAECKKVAKKPTKKGRRRLREVLGQEVGGQRPGTWPMTSLAIAVHPKQVAEANKILKAAGTTAYHKPDGSMVIPDAAQRKKVIGLVPGRVDFDSFS